MLEMMRFNQARALSIKTVWSVKMLSKYRCDNGVSATNPQLLLLSIAIYAPILIASDTLPIILKYKDIFLKITGGVT